MKLHDVESLMEKWFDKYDKKIDEKIERVTSKIAAAYAHTLHENATALKKQTEILESISSKLDVHHKEIQNLVTSEFTVKDDIKNLTNKVDKGFNKVDKEFSDIGHNVGKALSNNFDEIKSDLNSFKRSFKKFTEGNEVTDN